MRIQFLMLTLAVTLLCMGGTSAHAQTPLSQWAAEHAQHEEPDPRTEAWFVGPQDSEPRRPAVSRDHRSSEPPVRPDYRRGPRAVHCVDFDRTRPLVCNTNPAMPSDRSATNCRTYRDNGGTVQILCPEDRPGYDATLRAGAVARVCGENAVYCIGAYFKREYERCTYRVVPDHYPVGPFDVRVSDLVYQYRVAIYRPGDGRSHRDFESQYNRQVRYQLYNERHPYRWQDPCRAS